MNKQLSWQIIKYILGVYVLLGLIITTFQVFFEYKRIKSDYLESMSEVSVSFVEPITLALWDVNLDSAFESIKGMTSSKVIVGAKISTPDSSESIGYGHIKDNYNHFLIEYDDKEDLQKKNIASEYNLIEYQTKLYSVDNDNEYVGTLYLYSSENFIIDKIKVGVSLIIFKFLLQLIVLTVISLVTIIWIVSTPLKKLEVASMKINPESGGFSLNSNYMKSSKLLDRSDELGILAKSMEAARIALLDRDEKIRDHSNNLEEKVLQRTQELKRKNADIQSILQNMQQGIFLIQRDLSIHHEYSKYLETIFNTTQISGANAIDLLFNNSTANEDEVNRFVATLDTSIGDSSLNFILNKHLLPNTIYKQSKSNVTQILEVNWEAILEEDNTIAKIMVILRDVTELRNLQKEASIKEKQLTIINQIVKSSLRSWENFFQSSKKYLDESMSAILYNETSPAIMSDVIRNIHTIKGNSRTLDYSYIAEAVHKAESHYLDVIQNSKEISKKELIRQLDKVDEQITEYNDIFYNKIKDLVSTKDDSSSIILNKCKDIIEASKGSDNLKENYEKIVSLLSFHESLTIKEILEPIILSVSSIAIDLGKPVPTINIKDNGIRLKKSSRNMISDVFMHFIRNSMDHGLESLADRERLGKNPQGCIDITLTLEQDKLRVEYFDDGKGLNLAAIYAKTPKVVNSQEFVYQEEDLANSIFESGVSTAEKVTDISGRGVGLSAVKYFINRHDGEISIEFTGEQQKDFRPFKFIIQLPKEMAVAAS